MLVPTTTIFKRFKDPKRKIYQNLKHLCLVNSKSCLQQICWIIYSSPREKFISVDHKLFGPHQIFLNLIRKSKFYCCILFKTFFKFSHKTKYLLIVNEGRIKHFNFLIRSNILPEKIWKFLLESLIVLI